MDQIEVDMIDSELLQAVFTGVFNVSVAARPLCREVELFSTPA